MSFSLLTFRRVAVIEAISFLTLLAFSYLKNFEDGSESAVMLLGSIHGLLFIAYIVLALQIRDRMGWANKALGLVLLGAVLPFGGFVVDRNLAGRRTEESG